MGIFLTIPRSYMIERPTNISEGRSSAFRDSSHRNAMVTTLPENKMWAKDKPLQYIVAAFPTIAHRRHEQINLFKKYYQNKCDQN